MRIERVPKIDATRWICIPGGNESCLKVATWCVPENVKREGSLFRSDLFWCDEHCPKETEGAHPEAGQKDDQGKLRYDLIPVFPLALVAEVYAIGARKYADRDWEKGMQWGRVYRALQSHANAFWSGEQHDPIDGQHHLASVVWCALALMEYERTYPELDDRAKTK